jgi:hypothetical protein
MQARSLKCCGRRTRRRSAKPCSTLSSSAYIKEYGQDEGEAFFLQEYDCDFNAPLAGSNPWKIRHPSRARGPNQQRRGSIDLDGSPIYISPTLASVIQPHGGSGSQSPAASGSWTTTMIPA